MAYILPRMDTVESCVGKPAVGKLLRLFPRGITLPSKMSGEERRGEHSTQTRARGLHQVLSKIISANVKGKEEKTKVIWLLGRYGTFGGYGGSYLKMSADSFKQYAFGMTRTRRVFQQLLDFEVGMDFDETGDGDFDVTLSFRDDDNGEICSALNFYVRTLLGHHSEDDGLELFMAGGGTRSAAYVRMQKRLTAPR